MKASKKIPKYQKIIDTFEEEHPNTYSAKEGDTFKIEVRGDFNASSIGAAFDRLKRKGLFICDQYYYTTSCFVFEKVDTQINRWLIEPLRFYDNIGLERNEYLENYTFTGNGFSYYDSKFGSDKPAERYVNVEWRIMDNSKPYPIISKLERFRYENNVI